VEGEGEALAGATPGFEQATLAGASPGAKLSAGTPAAAEEVVMLVRTRPRVV